MQALVLKFMIHGPCGAFNPSSSCMQDGKCIRNFPKPLRPQTTLSEDSYASYRRRNTGRLHRVGPHHVDNRFVVPYSPYLLFKYQCHINVESVFSLKSVKYIYKYVYKGGDRATVEFSRDHNEVKHYLDARFITASEACWRLFEFGMHSQKPAVVKLQVHLPAQQPVVFNPAHQPGVADVVAQVQMGDRDSTLTAFFKANQRYPDMARALLYHEFPQKFVWAKSTREWKPRQRGFAIGRMYYVQPTAGEKFYLRLLLTAVRGPLSFADLRTYRHVTVDSFEDACRARGLLHDDREWHICLEDASAMQTGSQLRRLFVTILLDCAPVNPLQLWLDFQDSICDDLRHALQHRLHPIPDPSDEQVHDYGLFLIDSIMQQKGKSLADIHSMPTSHMQWEDEHDNPLIAEQLNYDHGLELQSATHLRGQFNLEQEAAFSEIVLAVRECTGQCFFLQGAGGCGKTFVYSAVSHHIRAEGKIVLCVASSGIASLLLPGGTTGHYRFKIPLTLHERSSCSIMRNTHLAELLRATSLIIWDEALMLNRHAFEAVDRCLRDIRGDDRLFGGVSVVFGGDYQQILPVIPRATQPDIVSASLFCSPIWRHLRLLKLVRNMRVQDDPEERDFAQWLVDVGHGRLTDAENNVDIPPEFCCPENTVESLIDQIYPNIGAALHPPCPDQFYSERAILSARNADVSSLNDTVLDLFPGDLIEAHSADSVMDDSQNNQEGELLYPAEYLNSITSSGLPLAHLKLKIGCPVMLLRNLDPQRGLCNGSRGILTRMTDRVMEIRLINGTHAGETHFIPRIKLISEEADIPFPLCRQQFPVRLAFSMSINKAQGQSLQNVGLDFRSPVFTHGQFYVAVSRATSVHRVKAIWDPSSSVPKTKNIVYQEVVQIG